LFAWSAAAAGVVEVLVLLAVVLVDRTFAEAGLVVPVEARLTHVRILALASAERCVPVVAIIARFRFALEVADIWVRVEHKVLVEGLLEFAFAATGFSVPNLVFIWNRSKGVTTERSALAKTRVEVEVVVHWAGVLQESARAVGGVPVALVGDDLALVYLGSVGALLCRADAFTCSIVPLLVNWAHLVHAVAAASLNVVVLASGARNLSLVALVGSDIKEFVPMALLGHGNDSASSHIPVKQIWLLNNDWCHALALTSEWVEDSLLLLVIERESRAILGDALAFAVELVPVVACFVTLLGFTLAVGVVTVPEGA